MQSLAKIGINLARNLRSIIIILPVLAIAAFSISNAQTAPAENSPQTDNNGVMTISASGQSDAGGNPETAQEEAVDHALSNCLLKALNDVLGKEKVKQNLDLIQEKMLSRPSVFVMGFTEEKSYRYKRVTTVEVTCRIHRPTIAEQVGFLGLMLSEEELPRIMVLVAERGQGQSDYDLTWETETSGEDDPQKVVVHSAAEKGAIESLAEKGIVVVDPVEYVGNIAIDKFFNAKTGKFHDLEETFKESAADLIIYGTAEVNSAGWISSTRQKATVRLNLFAANVKSGDFITTVTLDGDGISNEGTSQAVATAKRRTASAAVRRMLSDLLKAWTRILEKFNQLDLVIRGIETYSDLEMIKTTLQSNIEGIGNLYEKELVPGTLTLRVESKYDGDKFADKIGGIRFRHFKLGLVEASKNRVVVQFTRI